MSFANGNTVRNGIASVVFFFFALVIGADDVTADDPAAPPSGTGPVLQNLKRTAQETGTGGQSETPIQRRQRLAQYLTNCDFVGRFTTDGQGAKPPKEERYTIRSCQALDQPEMYELKVRIQYGSVDSEVPLKVRIVFADQTPVITLDQMWIPGMGTFDARVMIRRDRYAGTWQHDDHGGHLFGVIEQREE